MLLQLKNFSLRFCDAGAEDLAVKGIDLALEEGGILGLVGESGSGKTATAMTVCGLMERSRAQFGGELLLDGTNTLTCSEKEARALQGRTVSVVFQEPMSSLDPLQRIGRQVEEALRVQTDLSRDERRRRAIGAMVQVGLPNPEELWRRYPHELSGGQLQRVMIAAAIVTHPKLLVADEPTTALDVTTQGQILDLLLRLNREQGMAILFISHNLQVVRRLCREVAVMKDGLIVERGNVEDIFARPRHEYTQKLIAAIPTRQKRQV